MSRLDPKFLAELEVRLTAKMDLHSYSYCAHCGASWRFGHADDCFLVMVKRALQALKEEAGAVQQERDSQ